MFVCVVSCSVCRVVCTLGGHGSQSETAGRKRRADLVGVEPSVPVPVLLLEQRLHAEEELKSFEPRHA